MCITAQQHHVICALTLDCMPTQACRPLLLLQALITLEWLVAWDPAHEPWSDAESDLPTLTCLQPLLQDSEVQLAKALWKVVHQLLIHQLPDLSQDMQRLPSAILRCAAPSLKQPGLKDFQPFMKLVCATLSRITQDKAQYEPDPPSRLGVSEWGQEACHRFIVFWSFLGKCCC